MPSTSTFIPGKSRSAQISDYKRAMFSVVDIRRSLGVSARTVHRRLGEFNLTARSIYSEIGEQDLDHVVLAILREFPNQTGYRRMTGFLQARGLRVQLYFQ